MSDTSDHLIASKRQQSTIKTPSSKCTFNEFLLGFQDQLRKFVKFACNQERLPSRCTCQDGNPNTADVHVPPYPMKIGPPDGRGNS